MKNLFNKGTDAELKETSADMQKNINKIDEKIQTAMQERLSSEGLVMREKKRQEDLWARLAELEAEKNHALGVKSVIDSMIPEETA